MPQIQPSCSAAPVPKFMTLDSGMKAQVSLVTSIEPHDLVHYLGLEPAHLIFHVLGWIALYCIALCCELPSM